MLNVRSIQRSSLNSMLNVGSSMFDVWFNVGSFPPSAGFNVSQNSKGIFDIPSMVPSMALI